MTGPVHGDVRASRASPRVSVASALVALALLASACSFFGKVEPLAPRYYDPEPVLVEGPSSPLELGRPSVRLGHVVGASYLRERVAYRLSERELGFYEETRWTERPENYLRRALARGLFEQRGITSVVSGVGPSLDVELTDFSELLAPKHTVRVRARAVLIVERTVRFEHTFSTVEPVVGDEKAGFGRVATAMSRALERTVAALGDRVLSELTVKPDSGGEAVPSSSAP